MLSRTRLLSLTAVLTLALAACDGGAGIDVDADVDTDALAESVEDAAQDAGEAIEEGAEAAGEAAGELAEEVDENVDVEGEAETEVDAGDDAGEAAVELEQRPAATEDGDWGEFTYADAVYGAVARSCEKQDEGASVRTFTVVDGDTNNTLDVLLVTQNGFEYGVEVFHHMEPEPFATAFVEAEFGDMERLSGEGTFEDGTEFSFSLVVLGPPEC